MDFKYDDGDMIDDSILDIDVEFKGRLIKLVYCDFERDGCWVLTEFGTIIDFDLSPYFKEEEYEEATYMTIFNRDRVEGALEAGKNGEKKKKQEFMEKMNITFDELIYLAEDVFEHKETKQIFKDDDIERKNFFLPD